MRGGGAGGEQEESKNAALSHALDGLGPTVQETKIKTVTFVSRPERD